MDDTFSHADYLWTPLERANKTYTEHAEDGSFINTSIIMLPLMAFSLATSLVSTFCTVITLAMTLLLFLPTKIGLINEDHYDKFLANFKDFALLILLSMWIFISSPVKLPQSLFEWCNYDPNYEII